MNRLVLWCALLVFLVSTSGYSDQKKIGLILDRGGKDDKSFNSAAFRGATEAKAKLGIYLKEIEASDDTLFEPAMRSFAQKKFDLIIGVGVNQAEAMKKVARENPDLRFAIIDAVVDLPNVTSLIFDEHDGSYLVGYVAGLKSKTGVVGFVGGMKIPLIQRFELAYTQGAKAANPKTEVVVNYIGFTSEAWNNPTKAKEIAKNQYAKKADVIFTAAGASNNAVFDVAADQKKLAIGVDSNQNWIKPGFILTSMLKRLDTAVYAVISEVAAGTLRGGTKVFGLKNDGVDWALNEHNKSLFTTADLAKIKTVKDQLIAKKITAKDYYKLHAHTASSK